MSKLSAKINEEVVALIAPTIFFLFALSLIALIRVLMLKGTGIPVSSMVQIAVGALILGKAVVIADLLPFTNPYPERPLAYNSALVAMLIHYAQRLFDFWRQAGAFIAANEKLLAEIVWRPFLGHSDRSADTHFRLLQHA
jgi:hypothetical protein